MRPLPCYPFSFMNFSYFSFSISVSPLKWKYAVYPYPVTGSPPYLRSAVSISQSVSPIPSGMYVCLSRAPASFSAASFFPSWLGCRMQPCDFPVGYSECRFHVVLLSVQEFRFFPILFCGQDIEGQVQYPVAETHRGVVVRTLPERKAVFGERPLEIA